MKILRIIFINLLVFISLFGILEIFARYAFPEFKGHIFSESKSMNVTYIDGSFYGYQIRSPSTGFEVSVDKPLALIFGDSISGGVGTAYEDIWWHRLDRLLNVKGENVQVISISGYGNNMGDSTANIISAINKISADKELKIARIIYQFNYNDIMPYTSADLEASTPLNTDFFGKFAKWRYAHANKSVFLRTMQHYAGILVRDTSGTCEDREWHALGPYTWTFGSKLYAEESMEYWHQFEENLATIDQITQELGAKFEIFISPILYDIDDEKKHLHYNHLNYDFSCATIAPKERLLDIANKMNIHIYDPAPELKRSFEARIQEDNFEPYFFTADDNHFTPVAAAYIAEVIAKEWND